MFQLFAMGGLLLLSSVGSAEPLAEVHNCLSMADGECQVSTTSYRKEVSMWLHEASEDVPSKVVWALGAYYGAAKANNVAGILSSYSHLDGSRDIVAKYIEHDPEKYARFKRLKAVRLTGLTQVGHYYIVDVEWYDHDDGGFAQPVLVDCRSECKMSELLSSNSDALVSFASMVSISMSPVEAPAQGQTVVVPVSAEYPGRFSFVPVADSKLLKQRFSKIKEMSLAFKENAEKISQAGNRKADVIVSILQPYWRDPSASDASFLPGWDGRLTLTHIYSLANKFTEVKTLEPLFFVKGQNVDFVFFKMMFSDSDQRLAFFSVDTEGKIVPQIQLNSMDDRVDQAFRNRMIYESVQTEFMPRSL